MSYTRRMRASAAAAVGVESPSFTVLVGSEASQGFSPCPCPCPIFPPAPAAPTAHGTLFPCPRWPPDCQGSGFFRSRIARELQGQSRRPWILPGPQGVWHLPASAPLDRQRI